MKIIKENAPKKVRFDELSECIAVEKDTNKVYGCTELDCSRCLFGGEEVDCVGARKEWFAKMFGENKNG